ncbi:MULTISPECIES: hypothetical protein [unclassified Pseudoalteromonas]|uniref:hypothetical protein n=1 Tax=unclassified Pseudoalteromonas TaxID=194690 RepID=UPI0020980375|nr:hypothetical protein [Pseudoalteromonas sp. XMcav2-N]MCO7187604.1 hypothetical protein [Pseudoalteromonas sp. XMcav2-N]
MNYFIKHTFLVVIAVLVLIVNVFDVNPFVAKAGEFAYSANAPATAAKLFSAAGYADFAAKTIPAMSCMKLFAEATEHLANKPASYSNEWQKRHNQINSIIHSACSSH